MFIFGYFEEELLRMKCEKLLIFFNELSGKGFYNNTKVLEDYKIQYNSFNITSELLAKLADDHARIKRVGAESKSMPISNGVNLVHYVKDKGKYIAVSITK